VLDGDPMGPRAPHSSPSPLFGSCLLWPNGRPSQLLLSSCMSACGSQKRLRWPQTPSLGTTLKI